MNEKYTLSNVDFCANTIICAVNNETNKIYVDIESILKGIGLNEKQILYHRGKWTEDIRLSKGVVEIQGNQFMSLQKISLALSRLQSSNYMVPKSDKFDVYIDDLPDYVESHFKPQLLNHNIITSTPLSREELAAFMVFEERHVDIIEKTMTGFMKNQTAIMEAFINMQQKAQNNFYDSIIAILQNKQNPAAISWKTKVEILISDYCNANNVSKRCIMQLIYQEMSKRGVNVIQLRQDYVKERNLSTAINMDVINSHPEHHELFENCMNFVFEDYLRIKSANIKRPIYTPQIILDKISPLVFEGNNTRPILQKIYKKMSEKLGVELKHLLPGFMEKNGLKRSSISNMIANSDDLLKVFDEVVKELQ